MSDTKTESGLSPEEKQVLRECARAAIRARATGQVPPSAPAETDALRRKTGAFVSLHRRGKLRGCIGYVEAVLPLGHAVQEMSLSAAFSDPRFTPLEPEELDDLDIEISVLTPFEKISDPEQIEVGRHGLMIRKGPHSGLLLPQVPVEFGWDRVTFLSQTCAKAGLKTDAWRDPDTELFIFAADVF